jgi:hypothetical protein
MATVHVSLNVNVNIVHKYNIVIYKYMGVYTIFTYKVTCSIGKVHVYTA